MPRGKSAREFIADLKKFGNATREQAEVIFRKITIDLDRRVVLGTPVDTGRARGNWFATIGTPSAAVNDAARDKSGGGAIAAATSTAMSAELGTTVWLTNNLPYILMLENGSSQQAPEGMADRNVQAVAAKFGGDVVRS